MSFTLLRQTVHSLTAGKSNESEGLLFQANHLSLENLSMPLDMFSCLDCIPGPNEFMYDKALLLNEEYALTCCIYIHAFQIMCM